MNAPSLRSSGAIEYLNKLNEEGQWRATTMESQEGDRELRREREGKREREKEREVERALGRYLCNYRRDYKRALL